MFSNLESPLKKPVQNSARCPGPGCSLVSAFDLAKNFGFAQNHRFQTGSNPEQMPNGMDSLQPKKMPQFADLDRAVKIMKERFDRQLRILRDNIEFCPVTGRQEHTFLDARELDQPGQRIGQCRIWDRKSLADLDIGRLVTDAETVDIHLKRWNVRDKSNPPKRT